MKTLCNALIISALIGGGALLASCGGDDVKEAVNVTGVTVSPATLSLEEGGTAGLSCSVSPSGADDKTVSWSSDKPEVAAVDQTGKVTANKAGTATITVTTKDGGKTAECKVTVTNVAVATITISKTNCTLDIGQTFQLAASVYPQNATFPELKWESGDKEVASVDGTGLVKALKAGQTNITASADGVSSSACVVTVNAVGEGLSFTDPDFKAYLLSIYDINNDGILTQTEADRANIVSIIASAITDVSGIEQLPNLKAAVLSCGLQSLDLSRNKHLKEINVSGSLYSGLINLSGLAELNNLNLNLNMSQGFTVNLAGSDNIEDLTFASYYAESLDMLGLADKKTLKTLNLKTNRAASIDLCDKPLLTSLMVNSQSPANKNLLSDINLSGCPELRLLDISSTSLTSLDLSKNSKINFLTLSENEIAAIDCSTLPVSIKKLYLSNGVPSVVSNIDKLVNLEDLSIGNVGNSELDLSGNAKLAKLLLLNSSKNKLTCVYVKQDQEIDITNSAGITIKYK